MGQLWDIVERHLDRFGVREAALARHMGTSPQTLNSWKKRGVHGLPSQRLLEALARETGTAYGEILAAALHDTDYLPKESEQRGRESAPTNEPPGVTSLSTTPGGEEPRPVASQPTVVRKPRPARP